MTLELKLHSLRELIICYITKVILKDAIAKQEKKVTEINDIISTGPIYVVEEF